MTGGWRERGKGGVAGRGGVALEWIGVGLA